MSPFLELKCPHCHTGDIFVHRTFSLRFMKMHERCPACGFKFEIEPGFFWGSMYISYFISIFIALIVGFFTYFILHNPDAWIYLAVIAGVLAILSPPVFRYSRCIMLYLFGSTSYDADAVRKFRAGK